MIYHYRIRPTNLEDDIVSAIVPQFPRCIVYFMGSQPGVNLPPEGKFYLSWG